MVDPDARCPVCHTGDAALRYRITGFRVYDCRGCGLVYLWPRLTPEQVRAMFSRLYTEGEGSVPELRSYYGFTYDDDPANPLVQLYESWLDALERHRRGGRLLDIGCGTGLFLAVARRRGFEPYGVDDCAEAIAYARSEFRLDVQDGDFRDFAADGKLFDVITMWDIIEHAREPVELLSAAREVLAPDGVIGISTPNQRSILDLIAGALYPASGGRITAPLEKFYVEQHFLYYTPETLTDSCTRAGLEIVHLERQSTDLRRLSLSPPTRLMLRGLLALGRLSGLENRLFAIARVKRAGAAREARATTERSR